MKVILLALSLGFGIATYGGSHKQPASRTRAPLSTCGTRDADLSSDVHNCGACGHACNQFWFGNVCQAGSCVDFTRDANNCGDLGNLCEGTNPACVNSTCVDLATGE